MSGVAPSFVSPIVTSPAGFARNVVAGHYSPQQLAWMEGAFASERLHFLAGLLGKIREGSYVQPSDIQRAERLLERLFIRDRAKIRRAIADAHWRAHQISVRRWLSEGLGGSDTGLRRFDVLLPRQSGPIDTQLLLRNGAKLAFLPKPGTVRIDISGVVGREVTAEREVIARTPTTRAIEGLPPADAEEDLANLEWRRTVLPEILLQRGYEGFTSVALALNVLKNPHETAAYQVIALRILGDNLEELDRLDIFLPTLEAVMRCFDPGSNPQLQEMALAFLINLDSSHHLLWFFERAVVQLEGGSHSQVTYQPNLPGSTEPFTIEDLEPYRDRIIALSAELRRHLSAPLSSPSAFETDVPSDPTDVPIWGGMFRWQATYPSWYSILPEVLGDLGTPFVTAGDSLATNAQLARETFSGPYSAWIRTLGLVYFSFLLHPSQRTFLTQEEADQTADVLLNLMEEGGQLAPIAKRVYVRLIYHQINAELSAQRDFAAMTSATRWAVTRLQALPTVLRWFDAGEEKLWELVRYLSMETGANRPVKGPQNGLWKRVRGFFR